MFLSIQGQFFILDREPRVVVLLTNHEFHLVSLDAKLRPSCSTSYPKHSCKHVKAVYHEIESGALVTFAQHLKQPDIKVLHYILGVILFAASHSLQGRPVLLADHSRCIVSRRCDNGWLLHWN